MTPIFLRGWGGELFCSNEKYIYSKKITGPIHLKINQEYSDFLKNKRTTLFFKCYVPKELYHVSDI